MAEFRVVFGLNNETSIRLKDQLKEAAEEKGIRLQTVSRYRKEGVLQYVTEHPEYHYVILQEILQNSSPYTPEDVALLTDERHVKVIIVLNKSHAGNRYMRILYAAGILDALYEEDATAERIVGLLCKGRNRKEARKYYGIETAADMERELQIIEEERLKNYLSYIESGGPFQETADRYEFISSRLSPVENLFLLDYVEPQLAEVLSTNNVFCYFNSYRNRRKRSFPFCFRRKKVSMMGVGAAVNGKAENVVTETTDEAGEGQCVEMVMPLESDPESGRAGSQEMEALAEDVPAEMFMEEESLFDLFAEEDSKQIFHFMEKNQKIAEFSGAGAFSREENQPDLADGEAGRKVQNATSPEADSEDGSAVSVEKEPAMEEQVVQLKATFKDILLGFVIPAIGLLLILFLCLKLYGKTDVAVADIGSIELETEVELEEVMEGIGCNSRGRSNIRYDAVKKVV